MLFNSHTCALSNYSLHPSARSSTLSQKKRSSPTNKQSFYNAMARRGSFVISNHFSILTVLLKLVLKKIYFRALCQVFLLSYLLHSMYFFNHAKCAFKKKCTLLIDFYIFFFRMIVLWLNTLFLLIRNAYKDIIFFLEKQTLTQWANSTAACI